MARYSYSSYAINQPQTIMVGGVKMTVKEFKEKYQKKNSKPRKKARRHTSVTILPSELKEMAKGLRTLKSFVAYYEHGYRQWGNITKLIVSDINGIKTPFLRVVVDTKQATNLLSDIKEMAKKNDNDVFQFVRKLSWKLDDVKNGLDKLTTAISRSGVLDRFGSHECINGTGRRLGLQTLMSRTYGTLKNLNAICVSLEMISDNGADVSEYDFRGRYIK